MTLSAEWDTHTDAYRSAPPGRWRTYCDRLHLALIERELPEPGSRVLKTDLFDEAVGTGLVEGIAGRSGVGDVAGVDVSAAVASDASSSNPELQAAIGDLRELPFASGSFDAIVSNSSLDHFETRRELFTAIHELHRVTRSDGRVLITLDNLACPIIALRNALPYRLLRAIGIMRYPTGATLTGRGLRRALTDAGFAVERTATLMHAPRVLAIPWFEHADRRGADGTGRSVNRLLRWEVLGRLPTRHMTGHFVCVVARRP